MTLPSTTREEEFRRPATSLPRPLSTTPASASSTVVAVVDTAVAVVDNKVVADAEALARKKFQTCSC